MDAVALAYLSHGEPCPLGVRAHSTRSVASSHALAHTAFLADICRAAGWVTPNTFARFYSLRIEPVSSRVLGNRLWAGRTGRCHACCAIPPHPGVSAFFSSSSVPRTVNPGGILQAAGSQTGRSSAGTKVSEFALGRWQSCNLLHDICLSCTRL